MTTAIAKRNLDFVVVDRDEVPEGRTGRGQLSPASVALLGGETIWVIGDKNRAARFSKMAKPRGYRVRTRIGERGGRRGTYIWLETMDAPL